MDVPTPRQLAIDLLLKEHEFINGDLASRVERQSQAFNLVVVVVGVSITGVGALFGSNPNWHADGSTVFLLALEICVVLSASMCMTAPLALLFFDDELMIFASVAYIQHEWRSAFRHVATPAEEMIAPRKLFQGSFSWKNSKVKELGGYDHSTVASSRWLLFCLPLAVATLVLAFTAAGNWAELRSRVVAGLQGNYSPHFALSIATTTLYVLGCIAYARVFRAWCAALRVRRHCC